MAGWLLVIALFAQGAEAQNRDVRQGVAMYDAVDFRTARKHLERALERENLSAPDREIGLAYLARSFAALEQRRRAEKAFGRLLALNPAFRVSEDESPRIRAAFAAARELAGIPATPPAAEAESSRAAQPAPERGTGAAPPPDLDASAKIATLGVATVNPAVDDSKLTETAPAEPTVPWLWVGLGAGVLAIGGGIAIALLAHDPAPEVDATWKLD